jgi:hypothetical protein
MVSVPARVRTPFVPVPNLSTAFAASLMRPTKPQDTSKKRTCPSRARSRGLLSRAAFLPLPGCRSKNRVSSRPRAFERGNAPGAATLENPLSSSKREWRKFSRGRVIVDQPQVMGCDELIQPIEQVFDIMFDSNFRRKSRYSSLKVCLFGVVFFLILNVVFRQRMAVVECAITFLPVELSLPPILVMMKFENCFYIAHKSLPAVSMQ